MSICSDRSGAHADYGGYGHDVNVGVDREGQFKAYVNNRMNILLMWVQRVQQRDRRTERQHLAFFLWDMEHHFVAPCAERSVHQAFRWIKTYVNAYPFLQKKDRTQKVYEMISVIYEALGIRSPLKKGAVIQS